MAVGVAVAGLVIGAAFSVRAEQKQRRAQRAANARALEQKSQQVNAAAAEANVRRARILNRAEIQGVANSSGAAGASGAVLSDFGTAAAFANSQTQRGVQISNLQLAANRDRSFSQIGSSIAALGPSVGSLFQGKQDQSVPDASDLVVNLQGARP